MKMILLSISTVAMSLVSACTDETLSGYAQPNVVWVLNELDGKPFTVRANLTFPEPGKIAGQAPCNRYFGTQRVPYPWFETGPIASTKMACANLPAESKFFAALGEMTLSEVSGDTLILSNDAGREMVFTARR